MAVELGQILDALGGQLHAGSRALSVRRIATLETADAHSISFVSNPRYVARMAESRAGCIIVAPALAEAAARRGACIVVENPYVYFARLTQWWKAQCGALQDTAPAVHPRAVVHPLAHVHPTARIGPLCVVQQGAVIGPDTVLSAQVHIGVDCEIGARCLLHPGVVIGADGFGFASDGKQWVKIEQLGRVRVGDDVEIGANTCIDRGALDDTVIGDGVKIDNLVQIAHNVQIGAHTVIAGNVGIAGSAKIGAHCSIGGAANILGHLQIADGTVISPTSMVTRSLHQPDFYTGIFPLQTNTQWERSAASLKQLPSLRERVRKLERAWQEKISASALPEKDATS